MVDISVKKSTVCIVACLSAILTTTPCLADIMYISKSGTLMIRYGNVCSTIKPSGFYHFGKISGNLTALSCENLGGDSSEAKFTDISGDERCYGRMRQIWGRRTSTIWIIEGAVPGYYCSQSGKKFKIEMDDGKQI
jgi:hypothetical protein